MGRRRTRASSRPADAAALRAVTVTCAMPPEVSGLRVTRDATGALSFSWDALPAPIDGYRIGMTDVLRPAPAFVEIAAGRAPLGMAFPAGDLLFFRVGGRNLPDCLGSW